MSLQRSLALLLPALLASAAAFTWASATASASVAWMAMIAFALLASFVATGVNLPLWRLPATRVTAPALPVVGSRNAVLLGLIYAWGALAMIGAYRLAGLRWQHGLQYATGMVLLGLLHVVVARAMIARAGRLSAWLNLDNAYRLTLLELAAASAGVVFLVSSGKLSSAKPDWAANIVFLCGGLAVIAICSLATLTHARLAARVASLSGS